MVKNKEDKNTGKELTTGKIVKISIIIAAIAVVLAGGVFVGVQMFYKYRLDSYFVKQDYKTFSYTLTADVNTGMEKISETAVSQIKALPKVYVIPREQYKAPEPISENFDKYYNNYSDETITAHYYTETYYDAQFHFIEVTIAHPSQIRMALANNRYSLTDKKQPFQIAKDVNAVAAVDGCYYNVRNTGVLIYHGEIYRMRNAGWDVLLIDSEGDFHVVKDRNLKSSGILEQYDIVNSVTFGPALVLDGKARKITNTYGYPDAPEPRAAIAQLGKLHYLLCTVDGRQEHSAGVTQEQLADVLTKKGCQTAYNLDGGQSATLILGKQVKNKVAYGGQRKLGDIVYFATALDEN